MGTRYGKCVAGLMIPESVKESSGGVEIVGSGVFMTGGYGCIGSWVAKQLVETGREVWIFDLKEDTHRLDLILEPDQRASVDFIAGDVADRDAVRSAVERVGATHLLHLAGLQTPTCRANPIRRHGQRHRNAGRVRGGAGVEGSSATGGLRQLGGGPWSGRSGDSGTCSAMRSGCRR